jgi:hypothetical protein
MKVMVPRWGLVVAPAGESGALEPERDVCSWCEGRGRRRDELRARWRGVGGRGRGDAPVRRVGWGAACPSRRRSRFIWAVDPRACGHAWHRQRRHSR